MTAEDARLVEAQKCSLIPLRVEKLPGKEVLWGCQDDPFFVKHVTVWVGFDGNYAVSDTLSGAARGVSCQFFETYEELVECLRSEPGSLVD